MYVEKPIVRADSYMPDAQKKQALQLTRNGFRFRSTQRERVSVSLKVKIKPYVNRKLWSMANSIKRYLWIKL